MNPKKFQSGPQVWFIDEDPTKAAESMVDEALEKTITGAQAALVGARMYFAGARSKKLYSALFSRDRKDETMERHFPGWPYRSLPQFKFYDTRISKWCRKRKEHHDAVRAYLAAALDEWEFRRGRRHKAAMFLDWLDSDAPALPLPSVAGPVVFPWKALKLKYRRKDVVEGYRLQYVSAFCWPDPLTAYAGVDRDVPEFVLKVFNLDVRDRVS